MKRKITSPVLIVSCILATLCGGIRLSAETWNAALDLVDNEKPDQPDPSSTELLNPNGKHPQWSYGYRANPTGSGLTLFSNHENAFDCQNDNMEGWQFGSPPWPLVAANVSGTSNRPCPELGLLGPDELDVHPGNGFSQQSSAVVRWTAPAAGSYDISATWRDIDLNGGDGFGAHIVVNGVSIFDANAANGGSTSDMRTMTLSAGDLVDFVVDPGPSGDQNFDATALKADIVGNSSLRVFLNWNPVETFVPRHYSTTNTGFPFYFTDFRVDTNGSTNTLFVPDYLREDIQNRLNEILVARKSPSSLPTLLKEA